MARVTCGWCWHEGFHVDQAPASPGQQPRSCRDCSSCRTATPAAASCPPGRRDPLDPPGLPIGSTHPDA